jgi:hypothetical protein
VKNLEFSTAIKRKKKEKKKESNKVIIKLKIMSFGH